MGIADNLDGGRHQAITRMPLSARLEMLFRGLFFRPWHTLLVGGGDEPLYRPADHRYRYHRIIYRADYAASALHEVAHWCIAGRQRRQQLDYGYWYAPDGRTAAQQRIFEQVEVKPQALEWLFATAAGQPFRLSADNLDGEGPSPAFAGAVRRQARAYCEGGLPPRAQAFIAALASEFAVPAPLDPTHYTGLPK